MRYFGICVGASTISAVELSASNPAPKIERIILKTHEGNARKTLEEVLNGLKITHGDSICVTGRKFRNFINLSSITEPEAIEKAYEFVAHGEKYSAIVSAGGETFMVYSLDDNGKISNVYTGNKCASGTGEFFLQQIRRMDLTIEDAMTLARGNTPHKVAGRCSVFCKSDCTHALNKGEPKGNVVAGLCQMIAGKISELLTKVKADKVMIVGGTSQNSVVMNYLKSELPHIYIPSEAPYFEALGAALWSIGNETIPFPGYKNFYRHSESSFSFHPPLKDYKSLVTFKDINFARMRDGEEAIIGLDVGSTTTKAVILRTSDNAIAGSIYLRTNGDPVGASRKCYAELAKQAPSGIKIIGLGVTGSGRQIAGLHALTNGIINEIIAHATAAVYFDAEVDTIFEIGGQDAKYTYITSGVPSDYAMNEACSAGTGSFLEEAAKESLGIDVKEIADIAMSANRPPNFNDQCAAFISSDIKNAAHEGIPKEDIVAGLVYSICMNYANRVKGNRPYGKKIFMQGGVCYNYAVPVAMAALIGKEIIVPPEPGLMGAFGVALELKNRINLGLSKQQSFNLSELAEREVEYGRTFHCKGGKEKCDRNCEISTIIIKGQKYPFGGACNKYYNMRYNIEYDAEELDLVALRQKLIFGKYSEDLRHDLNENAPVIGINRSFLANSLFPLYYNFFTKLGMRVILPDEVDDEGIDKKGAAFCFPVEIAHGLFQNLINKKPDYIFLPHVIEIDSDDGPGYKKNCVFVQAEPFYLKTTFRKKLRGIKVLSPKLSFHDGIRSQEKVFIKLARELGYGIKDGIVAHDYACSKQEEYLREAQKIGKEAIEELRRSPEEFAVILFGRPYNSFAKEANMGIPHKFASRGLKIIPFDFLPLNRNFSDETMYWGTGRMLIAASDFVKKDPQLYGTFITNFSCGPDSFIITYFRDIMGKKPSLTLEIDYHTADAGLNTRIEAFIDIVKRYRELERSKKIPLADDTFVPAEVVIRNNAAIVVTASEEKVPLKDPRVRVLVPSMGDLGTEAFSAALRSLGVNAVPLPMPDYDVLKTGRGATTCKECLPMLLTAGSVLKYVEKNQRKGEILVYFMPKSTGPCRFGQYNVYLRKFIKKNRIPDVAVLTLSDDNSYAGLGSKFSYRAWQAIVISDIMEDIRQAINVIAVEPESAMKIFEKEWENIILAIERKNGISVQKQLQISARNLRKIPVKYPITQAKFVAIIGEIYVRRDALSRQGITDYLAKRGFISRIAPVGEYIYYSDYLLRKKLSRTKLTLSEKLEHKLKGFFQIRIEDKFKRILASSGLYEYEQIDVEKTIKHASHLISPYMAGESILTVGLGLREILSTACGVISIGPFGCMPSRVAESILSQEMNIEGLSRLNGYKKNMPSDNCLKDLPFLAIESDGQAYPQIIQAKLETFCLQADRIHEKMLSLNKHTISSDSHCKKE